MLHLLITHAYSKYDVKDLLAIYPMKSFRFSRVFIVFIGLSPLERRRTWEADHYILHDRLFHSAGQYAKPCHRRHTIIVIINDSIHETNKRCTQLDFIQSFYIYFIFHIVNKRTMLFECFPIERFLFLDAERSLVTSLKQNDDVRLLVNPKINWKEWSILNT